MLPNTSPEAIEKLLDFAEKIEQRKKEGLSSFFGTKRKRALRELIEHQVQMDRLEQIVTSLETEGEDYFLSNALCAVRRAEQTSGNGTPSRIQMTHWLETLESDLFDVSNSRINQERKQRSNKRRFLPKSIQNLIVR